VIWEVASGGRLATIYGTHPVLVALDLGTLELHAEPVAEGIVPVFDDPFTTYRVAGCEVTVYAANCDGAVMRGGELHSELRDWIAARYGVHRWSDPQWRR
jgi:hypothetical protein